MHSIMNIKDLPVFRRHPSRFWMPPLFLVVTSGKEYTFRTLTQSHPMPQASAQWADFIHLSSVPVTLPKFLRISSVFWSSGPSCPLLRAVLPHPPLQRTALRLILMRKTCGMTRAHLRGGAGDPTPILLTPHSGERGVNNLQSITLLLRHVYKGYEIYVWIRDFAGVSDVEHVIKVINFQSNLILIVNQLISKK